MTSASDRVRAWKQANPEKVREQRRRWRAADPDRVRAKVRKDKRELARDNAVSLGGASRHRQPWTLAELETALRKDLTAREAAGMLGRTIFAIYSIRQKVTDE